ncbi:MAG: molybdopterin-dependent oxidoreductase [Candidatus Margulisiibacteriota bacterium]
MTNDKLKKSICLFCSLGCGVCFRTERHNIIAIDYDKDNPINHGSLCPRGHYNIELLNHPQRISEPMIGPKKTSWEEAISSVRAKLKDADPASVGILLSGMASNEEALMAAKLAKTFGIKNVSSAGDFSDIEAFSGARWEVEPCSIAKVEDIDSVESLLIIGDILTRSPILSQRINKVKYGKRGNKIIVVDPNRSHTSWFATNHLKIKPGTEAALLAAFVKVISGDKIELDLNKAAEITGIPAERIISAAKDFHSLASGVIIISPSVLKNRNDLIKYYSKVICNLSPNKKQIAFYSYGNSLGVNIILDQAVEARTSYFDMVKKISSGEIDKLLMFGDNVFAGNINIEKQMEKMALLAISTYFRQKPINPSQIIFPLASHLEEDGSFTLADNRTEEHVPVSLKSGRRSNFDIISNILNNNEDRDKLKTEASAMIARGHLSVKTNLSDKISEAMDIAPQAEYPPENITHFGNNDIVKNFFWFKVRREA